MGEPSGEQGLPMLLLHHVCSPGRGRVSPQQRAARELCEFAQGLAPLAPGSGRLHAACLLVCSSI